MTVSTERLPGFCEKHVAFISGIMCEECRDELIDFSVSAMVRLVRPKIRRYARWYIRQLVAKKPRWCPLRLYLFVVKYRYTRHMRQPAIQRKIWQEW